MINDSRIRSLIVQISIVVFLILVVAYFFSNATDNLAKQNIATGFGFLEQEAGFEISETSIQYSAASTYQQALAVGILNTLKVALIGNAMAILLGIIVGIMYFSSNGLIRLINRFYVELLRNTPLLLQLFFWYALFTEIFPAVGEAWNPFPHVYLSNRGLQLPYLSYHWAWWLLTLVFITTIIGGFYFSRRAPQFEKVKWRVFPYLRSSLAFGTIACLIIWLSAGAPFELNYSTLGKFNFEGGYTVTPEYFSLLAGLVLYTSAFNAEIVRAGISSVSKGQWEVSSALGLDKTQTLGFIVLPQALRVMIPPMTSQVLNLTKNSSLAVAIAYPDFVSIANTTLNQTGQAIEVICLIMLVYLTFSIVSSVLMNWYNKKIALVTR